MSTTTPDFHDEYEGPTAEEAASVFLEASDGTTTIPVPRVELRSLDLRKVDWASLRTIDWRSVDLRELAGKVELPKVEMTRVEVPKIDLRKVDVRGVDVTKVTADASSLVTTATSKATETAAELKRSVESGVKIVRELVGR